MMQTPNISGGSHDSTTMDFLISSLKADDGGAEPGMQDIDTSSANSMTTMSTGRGKGKAHSSLAGVKQLRLTSFSCFPPFI